MSSLRFFAQFSILVKSFAVECLFISYRGRQLSTKKITPTHFTWPKEKPYKPVRYIMHGYDTLLHSFYDHYIVDYLSFREWDFDFNVMKNTKR